MNSLENLRIEIDLIDNNLINLLNERANVSVNIGLAKKACLSQINDPDYHIPSREKLVYEKTEQINKGPLSNEAIKNIYREIMSASIQLQKDISIAFLGPAGSYSYQAAYLKFGDSLLMAHQQSIANVFDAVENKTTTYGLVPFENSTFGSVKETLDRFITSDLKVRGEVFLPIHHCVLSKTQNKPNIKRIYSHPEAFGQCQRYLDLNYPGIEKIKVNSTSKAADIASRDPESAAVCSISCAELYNLQIVDQEIEDKKDNTTRFFILGDKPDLRTGNDKTFISFTVDHRQPGALCDALSVLKSNGINLTKIDSRPSRQRLWHYFFFVELEGHIEDKNVAEALKLMAKFCLDIKFMGSYHA